MNRLTDTSSHLHQSLTRLRTDLGGVLHALGLAASSSWRELSLRLDGLERNTAQRVIRLARSPVEEARSLATMPGAKAWHGVVERLERELGEDHPRVSQLRAGIDEFHVWLGRHGGSLSKARTLLASEPTNAPLSSAAAARDAWFQAAAATLGYRAESQLDVHLMRVHPDDDGRADHALVQSLNGLVAHRGSPPIAMQYRTDIERPDAASRRLPGGSAILAAGTSKPVPSMVQASGGRAQVGLVQQDWAERYPSLDLSVLNSQPGSTPVPWLDEDRAATFHTRSIHPVRRLTLVRVMSRAMTRFLSIEAVASRSESAWAIEQPGFPWYHRLTETAPLERFDELDGAQATSRHPGFGRIMTEAIGRLGWDHEDLVWFVQSIEHPIPFAQYSTHFGY